MSNQIQRASALFTKLEILSCDGTIFYSCNLCNNKKSINGTCKSNLLKHLSSVHRDIYKSKINFSANNSTDDLKKKRMEFMHHLIEMVTVNKLPFNALLSSGFTKLVAKQLSEFEQAGLGINLKDKNLTEVKAQLRNTAIKVRKSIENEVKNEYFSLSTDIGSKNSRSILSIYATYISDGIHRVRCIGMKELSQRHTGAYIYNVIEDCLKEFGFTMHQVASLTTDNASNMKTLVHIMNDRLEHENDKADDIVDGMSQKNAVGSESENQTPIYVDEDISAVLHQLNIDDEHEIDSIMNDYDGDAFEDWNYVPIQEDLTSSIENATGSPLFVVNGVNCAAHTVQLAVKDALKSLNNANKNIIGIARAAVKFIRKESTRNETRTRGLKLTLPSLDVETRWSSTYMMVR